MGDVYVLMHGWDCEGETLDGAWASPKPAEEFAAKEMATWGAWKAYDSYCIYKVVGSEITVHMDLLEVAK